jgi:ATP-binding cassette, subfamily B, beta-glucan exporter
VTAFLQLYLRVLRLLAPERRMVWLLLAGNVALAVSQFAEPLLFGRVIDALARAQGGGEASRWPELSMLLIAWASFGLFSMLAGTLVALHSDRLAHRRRHAMATDYFEHVLQLPLAFHGASHSGRMMKVMLQGTDALSSLWLGFFRDHFASFVSFLVLLPLTLFINWRLALVLIALCVVIAAVTSYVMRRTEGMQREVESHYSDYAQRAADALGNVALVQSFTRVESEVSALKRTIERLLVAQFPVLSWWAVVAVFARASTTFTLLTLVCLGAWLNAAGLASIGEIVTFMSLAMVLVGRLEQTVSFYTRAVIESARLREFFAVVDTASQIHDSPDAIDPGRLAGRVVFDNVSFSYDGRMPAVADLSFAVEAGEMVALVGVTGAGKSTALALLHRAFDPQGGAVSIDGLDIRAMKLAALRRNIGVVFQETLLFDRSIMENMLVGKPDATPGEISSALERAQALDFTRRHGEANVGERGRSLSGGERQRLSIARALLKDPAILVLDEATSALDSHTEARVFAALDEVMKGRTTFVIAHRLSTVRKADRILVFDAGRIVESGTFEELLRAGGRFSQLAETQFHAGYLAEVIEPARAAK